MARIKDYPSLKADVLATLERENDAQAQDLFDGWLSMCESEFAPLLKAPWATRAATFTWGDSQPYPPANPYDLRFEYLPPSYNGLITCLDLTNNLELVSISPPEIPTWRSGGYGYRRAFCIIGMAIFVLPDPGAVITLMLEYYSRQEPLTADAPVNAVIIQAPGIYKYGTLAQAALHYGEQGNFELWQGLAAQNLSDNNELDAGWRRGAGARVTVNR